jgi:rhamnulokinase
MSKYIAVDLGASSGRVILGEVNRGKIVLDETHRFENGPIEENGSLRWDFTRLLGSIKTGIKKAVQKAGGEVESIGVDSWGVDFGLIDSDGNLLENPYHYRDGRTDGMMDKAFELMPKKTIYDATGIQFMQINSIYQLLSVSLEHPEILRKVDKIIFMAGLVAYHLCGEEFVEYTLASTSQLMDMKTGQWSREIFDKLSLPMDIMPKVVAPGTIVGKLKDDIAEEFGCGKMPIVAVGSHDTASAVAAVPAEEKTSWAYLSSGTWSLIGAEISEAIVDDKTFKYEFTNEGGVAGTIRLLKNSMG